MDNYYSKQWLQKGDGAVKERSWHIMPIFNLSASKEPKKNISKNPLKLPLRNSGPTYNGRNPFEMVKKKSQKSEQTGASENPHNHARNLFMKFPETGISGMRELFLSYRIFRMKWCKNKNYEKLFKIPLRHSGDCPKHTYSKSIFDLSHTDQYGQIHMPGTVQF